MFVEQKLIAIGMVCVAVSLILIVALVLLEEVRNSTVKEIIMGLVDDLNGIKDQLAKAKDEIVGKLGSLQNALADATSLNDPAVAAAVDSLKEAAQALDDVVPDEVVAEVTEAVVEAASEAPLEPVVAEEEEPAAE